MSERRAFALVVFALQAKLMLRPEVLAIARVVGPRPFARGRWWSWAWLLSLLAWVQPTVFLIAAAHGALTLSRAGWRTLWRDAIPSLGLALALHGAIAAFYPFPLADLLHGLSLQGQSFAARNDGSLFIYHLRSDFFPARGLAMRAAFVLAAWCRPVLLLLLLALTAASLLLPADAFAPNHRPVLRTCPARGGVDLVTATDLANHARATECQRHAANALPPWLETTAGRLFRSSTGYRLTVCPAG